MRSVGVVLRVQLAQPQHRAVVVGDLHHSTFLVLRRDLRARLDEVDAVDGLVVLAHIVVAARAAGMVVEGHAGADDIDESRALVRDGGPQQWHQLLFVPRESARDEEVAPMISASETVSMGASVFTTPRFDFEPWSAVAENWPLVRPYTPLFSRM